MPRFDRPRLDAPTYPDVEEPTQQILEEPTQVWTGPKRWGKTEVAVPRPAPPDEDRDHPDLRLYDAVSSEPTDIVSASEAFRQLELTQKGHEQRLERARVEGGPAIASQPFGGVNEPFGDPTVPDVAARPVAPSISYEVERFRPRTRISFSVPMFVLFVLLCVSTGALLAWAFTYRLAGVGPFGSLLGG